MEKKMEGIRLEERSDIGGNYLVAIGCKEGGYKEEMLKNGKIEGLLPVSGQDFDSRHELWYATGGMQPLSVKFRQKAPGTAEITELMRQIEELAVKLEEYLLEPEEIGLALSWIFEEEEGEYLFLYLPGYASEGGGICRLLEELMEYMDYENHRAVSFLYLLHAKSRQQMGGGFTLYHLCGEILKSEQEKEREREQDDFFAEFEKTDEEKKREADGTEGKSRIRKIVPGSGWRQEAKEEAEQKGKKIKSLREKAPGKKNSKNTEKGEKKAGKFQGILNKFTNFVKGGDEDFAFEEENRGVSVLAENMEYGGSSKDAWGRACDPETGECADTVLLGGEELTQTVLLGSEREILGEEQYYLRAEKGERMKIYLSANPFCIGKEEGCDCVLKEPVISRHHAKILKEEGKYFLVDTHSLNGTYLNGRKLSAHTKEEIKSGDRIDFADLGFWLESDKR